ncbi:neo-calmodulin-like [Amphiura filiformis]|uniref:neo-calmodulin-like n=1 Tax=Amphiura filiformis TaxID=82378 RepID=UPI003B218A45
MAMANKKEIKQVLKDTLGKGWSGPIALMAEDLIAKADTDGDGKIDYNEIEQKFLLIDKNGDGKVTAKELGAVLKQVGQNPDKKQLKDMIASVDKDGSGTLDFYEFLELMKMQLKEQPEDNSLLINPQLLAAFKFYDKNGDGKVSKKEIKQSLKKVLGKGFSDEIAIVSEEMIAEADSDGDGKISYNDGYSISTAYQFLSLLGAKTWFIEFTTVWRKRIGHWNEARLCTI